jgi:NADPH:quinone reductase-like Zn-dependent oxidoreductase
MLVTGASSVGVGRFAVQLASLAGAEVVASVGNPARGKHLIELGTTEIVTDLTHTTRPVFGVLDNVGGPQLAAALSLLEPGGCAQSIGKASRAATAIDFEAERVRGGRRVLEPFAISTPWRSLVSMSG